MPMQTRLRDWREKRGLSLRTLGELSGVHYVSLVKLEGGKAGPSTLNPLEAVSGITGESLSIGGRDEQEGRGIAWG